MIKSIKIENFKSVQSLDLDLGRLNIFIGANGSGKSNILEAIAMGSAEVEDKLSDEFLANRGVRVTAPQLMKSGFNEEDFNSPITLGFSSKSSSWTVEISSKNGHYNDWDVKHSIKKLLEDIAEKIKKADEDLNQLLEQNDEFSSDMAKLDLKIKSGETLTQEIVKKYVSLSTQLTSQHKKLANLKSIAFEEETSYEKQQSKIKELISYSKFLIYAPENHFLRRFEEEAAIKPLGIRGEGLFKLVSIIAEEKSNQFKEIKNHLKLIDWFDDFEIPNDLKFTERRINIKDSYLDEDLQYFDQRSANEGFLYLLFYLTLFISDETPHFFSIDNIDNALNPKLGSELIKILAQLAKDHDKQALLTTHNPVILDGLDLTDDDQRLFVVYRNADGHTKVRRIMPQKSPNGTKPVRLSEAFIRGYIGGLPKNF